MNHIQHTLQYTHHPHVLHLVESFAGGCLAALSTLCRAVDVQHSVAYAVRPDTPSDFASLFPASVPLYCLPLSKKISVRNEIQGYWSLLRLLRQIRPDVLHCHSSKAGIIGRLAARWLGIPSIYTPHGYAFLRSDIPAAQRLCYKSIEWLAAQIGSTTVACGLEEYTLACQLSGDARTMYIPNALIFEDIYSFKTTPPLKIVNNLG